MYGEEPVLPLGLQEPEVINAFDHNLLRFVATLDSHLLLRMKPVSVIQLLHLVHPSLVDHLHQDLRLVESCSQEILLPEQRKIVSSLLIEAPDDGVDAEGGTVVEQVDTAADIDDDLCGTGAAGGDNASELHPGSVVGVIGPLQSDVQVAVPGPLAYGVNLEN